jgi:hypothetical protein
MGASMPLATVTMTGVAKTCCHDVNSDSLMCMEEGRERAGYDRIEAEEEKRKERGRLTQKISYTSRAPRRQKAVRKESSLSILSVAVERHSAMMLVRIYGRPRGMYSAGIAIETGMSRRDGRLHGRS